jgi:membrane protease subunit HflC
MSKLTALLALLAAAAFVLLSSIYTVSEVEQVIITQFGKPVGEPVTTAGLKTKIPFIQQINPIDKRVLEWDGNPSDMPTKDKLYISVDLFARWRITDPLQYFLRLRDERSAQSRLDDILGSETRPSAHPEGAQAGRTGDICRGRGKGSGIRYRTARHSLQTHKLQRECTPENL